MYGHESPECLEWAQRAGVEMQKFHQDLVAPDGPDIAARSYRWAGANFPGFYEDKAARGLGDARKKKPPILVSGLWVLAWGAVLGIWGSGLWSYLAIIAVQRILVHEPTELMGLYTQSSKLHAVADRLRL